MTKAVVLLALFAVVCVPLGCGGDDGEGTSAEGGSLTIKTDIDFTSEPVKGTFQVTEGSDELGCSGGTFVDQNVGEDDVNKVTACTDGDRRRVVHNPLPPYP